MVYCVSMYTVYEINLCSEKLMLITHFPFLTVQLCMVYYTRG